MLMPLSETGWDSVLQEARDAAESLLARDPELTSCPAAAERLRELFTQAADTLN